MYLLPGRQLDFAAMPIIRPTHERLYMEPERPAEGRRQHAPWLADPPWPKASGRQRAASDQAAARVQPRARLTQRHASGQGALAIIVPHWARDSHGKHPDWHLVCVDKGSA